MSEDDCEDESTEEDWVEAEEDEKDDCEDESTEDGCEEEEDD